MHRRLPAFLVLCLSGLSAPALAADDDGPPAEDELFRFDLGVFASFYTSAVERGTAGEATNRLATDLSIGLFGAASFRFWGPLSIGLYAQVETGDRSFGVFRRLEDDVAIVEPVAGGSFTEVWLGPLLRAQWRGLFAELGWGTLGLRSDKGRDDLTAGGLATGAFRTTPTIAWLLSVGGVIPLIEPVDLILRLNYRIRYYEIRGGEALDMGLAHGTQDLIPFIGAAVVLPEAIL